VSEANGTLGIGPQDIASLTGTNKYRNVRHFQRRISNPSTEGSVRFAHFTLGFNVCRLRRQRCALYLPPV